MQLGIQTTNYKLEFQSGLPSSNKATVKESTIHFLSQKGLTNYFFKTSSFVENLNYGLTAYFGREGKFFLSGQLSFKIKLGNFGNFWAMT